MVGTGGRSAKGELRMDGITCTHYVKTVAFSEDDIKKALKIENQLFFVNRLA